MQPVLRSLYILKIDLEQRESTFTCDQCDQKKSPNVYKIAQKWFYYKMIDFDTFTKIP